MSEHDRIISSPQEYIRSSLKLLSEGLRELAKIPPAQRKRFDYQTIAVLARTIFEGARLLHELPDTGGLDGSGSDGARRLTSAQMSELVHAELKRRKERKSEIFCPAKRN